MTGVVLVAGDLLGLLVAAVARMVPARRLSRQ